MPLRLMQNNRFKYVRLFAVNYPKIVRLLKGANSLITYNNIIYINPLGSNALSKGGSGDVLTGLIVSLLTQGYRVINSSILECVMSTRKHKRKAAKHSHKNQGSNKSVKQIGFVSTHPRAAMFAGSSLIVVGLFLLIMGMGSDAKFGLAMLSMAIGTIVIFFASSALPKKAIKVIK